MINFLKWLLYGKPLVQIDYLAQYHQITRPKTDESQNAAPLYTEAIELIGKIPKENQSLVYETFSQINDDNKKILKDFLNANSNALNIAKEASKKPFYWEEYNSYDHSPVLISILMPSITPLRIISRSLCLRAAFQAQEGQYDKAFDDILAAYRMGQHFRGKGSIIEQIVGISMESNSIRSLRSIIYTHPVDHRTITQWKSDFSRLIENENFAVSYEGSILCMYDELQRTFTSGPHGHIYIKRFNSFLWDPCPGVPPTPMSRLFHLFFRHPNKEETKQAIDRFWNYWEQLRGLTPYQHSKNRQQIEQQLQEITDKNYFIKINAPSLERVNIISYRLRTEAAAMKTIFASLEYHNQNNQYPDSLTQLVEAGLLDEIPADAFSDGPLVYRKTADSFILYSLGEDLTDDGGKKATNVEVQPNVWRKVGDEVFWPPVE